MDIKLGSIVKGEIIDFTHEGKGVIKVDNFTIFLEGGLIGDKVEAKIEHMKKSFATGRVINIIEPSKDRSTLNFPIEESLGGIPLVEYDYSKQLEWKTSKVKRDLQRI